MGKVVKPKGAVILGNCMLPSITNERHSASITWEAGAVDKTS